MTVYFPTKEKDWDHNSAACFWFAIFQEDQNMLLSWAAVAIIVPVHTHTHTQQRFVSVMNRGMCHSLFNSWQGVNKQIERLNILLNSHFIFSSIFNLCGMVAFYKCMDPQGRDFRFGFSCLINIMLKPWHWYWLGSIPESPKMLQKFQSPFEP